MNLILNLYINASNQLYLLIMMINFHELIWNP